jgi:parallel beta-helix repeat protein
MEIDSVRKIRRNTTLGVTVILLVMSGTWLSAIVSSESCSQGVALGMGPILYVGGSKPGNYTTIQSAINDAQSGYTIYVYDEGSPYRENLVISKSIYLMGENRDTTVIDGQGLNNVIHVSVDYVNISGFTIQNSGSEAGISINSDHNAMWDISFRDDRYGVEVAYSYDTMIRGCKLTDNEYGIYLLDSKDNRIFENLLNDHQRGIELTQGSTYNVIYGNTFSNNDQGIRLDTSSNNDIYWNVLTNHDIGIYIFQSEDNAVHRDNIITYNTYGIYLEGSSSTSIYDGNRIADNADDGIYVKDSDQTNIFENTISSNRCGINISRSSSTDIFWNTIEKNKHGIYLYHASSSDIFLNDIISNYQTGVYIDFSSQSRTAYNNFRENYISATFKQNLFSRNAWKRNYWDDSERLSAKKIYGQLFGPSATRNWIAYDFRPATNPYNI